MRRHVHKNVLTSSKKIPRRRHPFRGGPDLVEAFDRSFESGAQGEHKVARGFSPANTWSMHWIVDPRFRAAIADYLEREGEDREDYARFIDAHVPYKKGVK